MDNYHAAYRMGRRLGCRGGLFLCGLILYILTRTAIPLQAQQYNRTELSVLNGLGQGDVYSISQDSLGYIWITQQHGVSRFNGREFVQLQANPSDTNALPTTEVYHILHLSDGNAWFSHQQGLSFYNRKENRFTTYTRKNGLHCDVINSTFADGDSILYAAHWYGYDRINLKSFAVEWLRPFPQLQDNVLRHRSYNLPTHPKQNPYNANQLISIHQNDLYLLDKSTRQFTKITDFRVGQNPELNPAYYLLEYEWSDSSNLLLNFYPNDGEIYSYNLQSGLLTPIRIMDGKSLWINKIQRRGKNTFMCLENSLGAFRLETTKKQIELIDSTQAKKTYGSLFIDRQGVIWVGEHGYAYRYEPTQIITYFWKSEDQYISHIADPESGIILVFTYINTKVLQFENSAFKPLTYPEINALSSNTFFHPFLRKFVNFTGNSLYLFHPHNKAFSDQKLIGLDNPGYIKDMAPVADGMYIPVQNVVYFIDLNGKAKTIFAAENTINDIEYHQGQLLYSTLGHVFAFDIRKGENTEILHLDEFTYIPILVHQHVLYILWQDKLKYVALDSTPYVLRDTGLDHAYPDQDFLQFSVSGDYLLISAEFNLMKLNTKTLGVEKNFSFLDQIDIGYWDDVFSSMQGQYYLTTDTKKIVAFPDNLKKPAFLSYQVEEIEVNGQAHPPTHSIYCFQSDENNIVIKSDAVYTGVFDKLTYYYRNSNQSSKWVLMKSDVLQLLNQEPGRYSIDLKVVDRFGKEMIITRAAEFRILPPWYQTTWFYIACFILAFSLGFAIYQYRLKQVRKSYDFQSKLQQLEMTALKAQMNPHFIFNCLNSIKGLILIGEAEKAVSYIGTFSKLVRNSLDSAEEKLLTLKEELEIAENYLSLEQLRYGPKLKWSIRCQDESLMTTVKIPPFILQPLIENAIVHGIKYTDHDGFIHILAYHENTDVHIKIIDNGVGLKYSKAREEHNEHTTRKHLGISMVKRRLMSINATLSIYEHEDNEGKVSGTTSEIIIPQHHE